MFQTYPASMLVYHKVDLTQSTILYLYRHSTLVPYLNPVPVLGSTDSGCCWPH